MRRCSLVSALPWANRMSQRSREPDALCWRGITLVARAGMRYDAAAIFGRFRPFRPPIAAIHRPIARPHPGGAHGSRPSVVPARSP
jgi:hypothetical protein